jgi:hypothetical protein
MIWFTVGLILGLSIGRVYGHMKYRLPEFQEVIRLREAKLRAERASYEAEEEQWRLKTDEMLRERMR